MQPIRGVAARPGPSSRAALAAARVAARYAKAPSYSQMQAAEARAALEAAQLATQAALEAQDAAKAALDDLEAAAADPVLWEPEEPQTAPMQPPQARLAGPSVQPAPVAAPLEPAPSAAFPSAPPPAPQVSAPQATSPQVRWDADFPVHAPAPAAARAPRPAESAVPAAEVARNHPRPAAEPWDAQAIEPVEAVVPLHANLIQFPRELVATRKVRPRLAEGPLAAAAPEMQLSIFEVDPGTVSTQPQMEASAPAAAGQAWAGQTWAGPEWSGIELEAQSAEEALPDDPPDPVPVLEPASFSRRLLAAVVDGALITGAFLGAAAAAMHSVDQVPPMRVLEVGAASALAFVALLYQLIFFTLAESTPGMKYARVALCTFEDLNPTRAQVRRRLAALLVSALPIGLGIAWAIFDENHLMWHDRLSRTYLRKC